MSIRVSATVAARAGGTTDPPDDIRVPPDDGPHHRGRLSGMHFEIGKVFLLPSAMTGMRNLKSFYDQHLASHPRAELLITGHTDTDGPAQWNVLLSVERAKSVRAFLTNAVDDWMFWFRGGYADISGWGLREVQLMLSALGFYPGTVNGAADAASRKAVGDFQTAHNARGLTPTLPTHGLDDADTREAVVRAYMGIDGTTLTCKTVIHGCGPYHNAVNAGQGVSNADNRRVEIFFFEQGIQPPAVDERAPGCAEYQKWTDQIEIDLDLDQPLPPPSATLRVRPFDWAGYRVSDAPFRITVAGEAEPRTGNADGDTIVVEKVPAVDSVLVEWANAFYDDGTPNFEFRLELFTRIPDDDENEAARRRLHNLGYSELPTLDQMIRSFQAHIGVAETGKLDDVKAEIKRRHDEDVDP